MGTTRWRLRWTRSARWARTSTPWNSACGCSSPGSPSPAGPVRWPRAAHLLRPPPLLGTQSFALTALTAPVNLAGLPALALPVPAAAGVIASIQVIGLTEERVLAFGRVIETALRA